MTADFETDPQSSDLHRRLQSFLADQTTMTLSSVTDEGNPHSCDLFYAHTSKYAFYFLSDPKTRHSQNIARMPRVSVTIHGLSRGWEDIRGVQMEGIAMRVSEPLERLRAFALYAGKYGFIKRWLTSVDTLGVMIEGLGVIELYRFSPQWLRFIDNSLGFGHKDEINISTGS